VPDHFRRQQGIQLVGGILPPERILQTLVAGQRFRRFDQRPIHRKTMWTHPRDQRDGVNGAGFNIFKRFPHNHWPFAVTLNPIKT